MPITTLFTAHHPVEKYLRLDHATPPDLALRALDSFLLRQLARFFPVPITLFDLAADATGGASAMLAVGHYDVFHRIHIPAQREPTPAWRTTFPDALALLGYNVALPDLDTPLDLENDLSPLSPPMFLFAPGDTSTADVVAAVEPLLVAHPRAFVGLLSGTRRLAVAASFTDAGYIVTDTRETHALFKQSDLTLIANETTPGDVLRRISYLFDGNLNHVSLPESINVLREKLDEKTAREEESQ